MIEFINKIFDFRLTPSQTDAVNKIDKFLESQNNCFVLMGYAGTGKTTLLKGISRYLSERKRNFLLMAPTGRAAKIIRDKTNYQAFTIHKSIYSMDDLKEYKITNEDGSETYKYYFDLRNNDDPVDTVYIVDESSMVSDQYSESEFFRFGSGHLLQDFLQYTNISQTGLKRKIIFIGDPAQLPPVRMNHSPALDLEKLSNRMLKAESYEMIDIMRQDIDSGILKNATALRAHIKKNNFNSINIDTDYDDMETINHEQIVDKYLYENNAFVRSIIIAHSNKSVQLYNNAVREKIFPGTSSIQPGDLFLVVRNNYNYNLLNGEFGSIINIKSADSEIIDVPLSKIGGGVVVNLCFKDVEIKVLDDNGETIKMRCKIIENLLDNDTSQLGEDEQRALYVLFKKNNPTLKAGTPLFKEAIKVDPYFNALQIKYGYCVTCHKAQGGEWDRAIIDFNTAQSPYCSDYFRWCYTAITRCKLHLDALSPPQYTLSGEITNVKQKNINITEGINVGDKGIIEKFHIENDFQLKLHDNVVSNIEEKYHILEIKHLQYRERYIFDSGSGKISVDIIYNGKNEITSVTGIEPENTPNRLLEDLRKMIVVNSIPETSVDFVFSEDLKAIGLDSFYEEIKTKISGSDISISDIKHNPYQEKYVFTRKDEHAVIVFYYNKKGRVNKAMPENNQKSSDQLVEDIEKAIGFN